jgi:hypothetical protein
MISKREPYADRHFFADEELQNDSKEPTSGELRAAYQPEMASNEHFCRVRDNIAQAMEEFDEMALSASIERAQDYGSDYPWLEELDAAKKFFL